MTVAVAVRVRVGGKGVPVGVRVAVLLEGTPVAVGVRPTATVALLVTRGVGCGAMADSVPVGLGTAEAIPIVATPDVTMTVFCGAAVARTPVIGIPTTVARGRGVAVALAGTGKARAAAVGVETISGAVGRAVRVGGNVTEAGGEGVTVTKGRPISRSGAGNRRRRTMGVPMTVPRSTRLTTRNR